MIHRGRFDWAVAIPVVLVTGLIAVGIWKFAEYRAKCTDNGGHWETYDCHTVTYTQCHDINSGQTQICMPATRRECSERCVGASAEAQ
jgi:hypothetical protein